MKEVIYWSNGVVMVFDDQGQQMPEYQGKFSECKQKILDAARPDTQFQAGIWNHSLHPISRDEFCRLGYEFCDRESASRSDADWA